MNYYNEHDPKAAAWLRELIAAGLIPLGDVDERSITTIQPDEIKTYTQCHFFAGIGGWSYALQLANWPATRPVWTGSCPCQPFSSAGKNRGQLDERHLWPAFFRLIREHRPDTILGEQVASAIGHGWLDGIQSDLEGESYAVGHCVLGAHSVGAPHIRQRLYWVADATSPRRFWQVGQPEVETRNEARVFVSGSGGENGGMAHPEQPGLEGHPRHSNGGGKSGRQPAQATGPAATTSGDGGREHTTHPEGARLGPQREHLSGPAAWGDWRALPCRDGKTRRIKSGLEPLAHGISGRVGLLRGYGNAIVPQVAAEFIKAFQAI